MGRPVTVQDRLVRLPVVDDLPGVRVWRGLGPSASVSAQPWNANVHPEG